MLSLNNVSFHNNRIISSAYIYDIQSNRGVKTHNFLTGIFVNIFGAGTIKVKVNGHTSYVNKGSCFKLITNNMFDKSSAAYKKFKTQNNNKIISDLQKIFDSKINVSTSLQSNSHPKTKTSIKDFKNDLSDKKTSTETSSSVENKSQKSISSKQNSTALTNSKSERDQKIDLIDKPDSPLKPIVENDINKLDELQKNSTALMDSQTEIDQKINFADKLDSPPKPTPYNNSSSNENAYLKNPSVSLSNSELQPHLDAFMQSIMKEIEKDQATLKVKHQKRNEELIQASKDMVAQAEAHLKATREKNQKELTRLNLQTNK